MSLPTSVCDIDDLLNSTDREDFSLFLRYPDIDSDGVDDASSAHSSTTLTGENKGDLTSSSPSARAASDYRNGSLAIESTAHETPSRLWLKEENTKFGGWNEFIHLVQKSDLPQECLQYFTSLGQTILNIGTVLHSTLRPNQPSNVLRIGRWLLTSVKYSSKQVAGQVEAISHLKSLVAFNVNPGELQIWSTYRQRVQLILKNVSLPSKREKGLIESLILLYDAYVYNPFLQLYTVDHYDKQTFNMINEIYDKLMKWLQNYKIWCRGMVELRCQHLQPLIDLLSRSEKAKKDLADLESRIMNAKVVLTSPIVTSVDLIGDQIVDNLNLSVRGPAPDMPLSRTRTRYKREHTV